MPLHHVRSVGSTSECIPNSLCFESAAHIQYDGPEAILTCGDVCLRRSFAHTALVLFSADNLASCKYILFNVFQGLILNDANLRTTEVGIERARLNERECEWICTELF